MQVRWSNYALLTRAFTARMKLGGEVKEKQFEDLAEERENINISIFIVVFTFSLMATLVASLLFQ